MVENAFQGLRVLITGALGTLGRAQALAFRRAGANLVLLDKPQMAESLSAFLSLTGGEYVGLDLNDIHAAHDHFEGHHIDVLVNNAAMIINKPYDQFSIEEYETQVRVNSSAAFALIRAVAPGMRSRGYGKIVNFCSLTLNGQWDGYTPYVASKGAMLGLTKAFARELGPHGVRVNAISPGAVVSEAEARVFSDRLEQYNKWVIDHQCLKHRVKPEDVADLVLFLSSSNSDSITGQNIGIDGGW